jgi:hypothetical protein
LIKRRCASDESIAALMAREDDPAVVQQRALRQSLRTEVKRARKELYSKWFINSLDKADCYAHKTIGYEVHTPTSVLEHQRAAGVSFWRGGKNRQLLGQDGKIVNRPETAIEAEKPSGSLKAETSL